MYCDLWPCVLWPLDFQIQKRIVSKYGTYYFLNLIVLHREIDFKFIKHNGHHVFVERWEMWEDAIFWKMRCLLVFVTFEIIFVHFDIFDRPAVIYLKLLVHWEIDFKLDNTWEDDALFWKVRSPVDDCKFEDNNCIILKLTYLNVQPVFIWSYILVHWEIHFKLDNVWEDNFFAEKHALY